VSRVTEARSENTAVFGEVLLRKRGPVPPARPRPATVGITAVVVVCITCYMLSASLSPHIKQSAQLQQNCNTRKSCIADSFIAMKLLHHSCRLISMESCLLQNKAVCKTAMQYDITIKLQYNKAVLQLCGALYTTLHYNLCHRKRS